MSFETTENSGMFENGGNYSFTQDSNIESTITNNTNNTNNDNIYKEKESTTNTFEKTVETQTSGGGGALIFFGLIFFFLGVASFFNIPETKPKYKKWLGCGSLLGLGLLLFVIGILILVGVI